MKLIFVRHAQSESNVDPNILRMQTNMAVKLSAVGVRQATETGKFLAKYLEENKGNESSVKVWNSPYNRTRQTANLIKTELDLADIDYDENETIYIAERQFGLVDDVENYLNYFKHEARHYKLHKDHNHDFFARPPLGESPFDMCLRLDAFLRTVVATDTDHDVHIIVSHGAAIRGMIMMDQELPYEEYTCPNPYNASVRVISDGHYLGEVFVPREVTA